MATYYSDEPAQGASPETASSPGRASIGGVPGGRIGPYKLLSLLGEGGFGVVYLAEQTKPVRRRVANLAGITRVSLSTSRSPSRRSSGSSKK